MQIFFLIWKEPYALFFANCIYLKNIISCYFTVLKEICAKYQIACNKLEFCYQNLKSDLRGWGDSSVLHARHSLGLYLFRLELDLSSICSYLLYFSQRHYIIASVWRYFLRLSGTRRPECLSDPREDEEGFTEEVVLEPLLARGWGDCGRVSHEGGTETESAEPQRIRHFWKMRGRCFVGA